MVQFFLEDISFDLSLLTFAPAWLQGVIRLEQQSLQSLNFILCSDPYLLDINREFLQHDYFTDVITFDQRDSPDGDVEGDIFISIDRVLENSQLHQTVMLHELLRVMVHGALHLLGYHDKDEDSQQQMRNLEDQYLSLYFLHFEH